LKPFTEGSPSTRPSSSSKTKTSSSPCLSSFHIVLTQFQHVGAACSSVLHPLLLQHPYLLSFCIVLVFCFQ
ncbi:hypothetical protein HN873_051248, partial [Arachis hypogaea]